MLLGQQPCLIALKILSAYNSRRYPVNASDSGALPGHLSHSDNFGWALQAGADFPLGTRGLFFNFDVKKIFLSTGVKLAGVKSRSASIDPWIIGVGLGIKL